LNLGDYACLADLKEIPVSAIPPPTFLPEGFLAKIFPHPALKRDSMESGESFMRCSLSICVFIVLGWLSRERPPSRTLKDGAYLTAILKAFEAEGYHFDLWELYAPTTEFRKPPPPVFCWRA
jgi:hypothetical protein